MAGKAVPTAPNHDRQMEGAALLIVDVLNPFDFKGAESLKKRAEAVIQPILTLRSAADARNIPTVYVNDNFGEWHSEKSKIVGAAKKASSLARRLAPRACDYFVIKPHLSAFYATNLPVLLPKLGIRRLVLCGVATDMCILFSAADAHMRDYDLWIPADATTAQTEASTTNALAIIAEGLGAEIKKTSKLSFSSWHANCQQVR